MRALITGAGGFVGKFLAEHCLSEGDVVIATGRPENRADLERTLPRAMVDDLDVCKESDVARVLDRHRPDVIYHLAALTFLPEVEKSRKVAFDVNVGGTMAVLDGARSRPGVRVLFISSAQVYSPSLQPISESGAHEPSSYYGMTKRMGEQLSLYYAQNGVHAVVARPFNHSGRGQQSSFVLPSFAKQVVDVERGARAHIIKVGNLESIRDFLDVRDVVRAYRLLMSRGAPGEIYNVCSGRGRTILSALQALIARAKVKVEIEIDPARLRAQDTSAIVGDFTKIHNAVGWNPEIPFENLLDELLDSARGAIC
ncbi:MAG: GDP-mannose 4,6-dehydratase [Planctomycetes bacterium]|nr:GDP-mannose 4,6-dehydratase [Planctomycetota bacterium]